MRARVVDGEPFKETFQRIPPMVEEVRAHVKEMLEVGAICPRQSPCCNAIMLVRKKDGGLCFSIDLHKLNVRTKNDSYLFKALQQYTSFMVENLGFFECEQIPFEFLQCPCNLPEVNTELPRQVKPNVLPNLLG